MINHHASKPTLPRPKRCPKCGGAIVWHTAYIQCRRIDTYRCINGHSSEDVNLGVSAFVEQRRE